MKLKISFDKVASREFFVEHSEKIIFAAVVLCFLFFVYRAVGRDRFEKTPDELITAADGARQHVLATAPEPGIKAREYSRVADRLSVPIEVEFYQHEATWRKPLFPPRSKRAEPKLYTVRKLRGSAGSGPFAAMPEKRKPGKTQRRTPKRAESMAMDEGMGLEGGMGIGVTASAGTKGWHWIVLTGLVPITEQEEAFRQAFEEAQYRNSQSDMPDYIYYRVERVEVKSLDQPAEPEWERLHIRNAMSVIDDRWPQLAQEVVDQEFVHDVLTFPLGPLVGREWGAEVAHEPEIPVMVRGRDQWMEGQARTADDKDQDKSSKDDGPVEDNPELYDKKTSRRPGRAPEAEGVPGRFPRRGTGRPFRGEMGEMDEGGLAGPGMGRLGKEPTPFLLFRFFDFNVEPAKKYRYRVRLLLRNPNYKVEPRYLVEPELAEKQWIESEWSEPTDVITVGRDDRLLAVSVKSSLLATVEPYAKITVIHQDEKTGLEPFKVVERALVGQILNYSDKEVSVSLPSGNAQTVIDTVSYKTDSVLLDVRGGNSLPGGDRSTTEPGEMLVLEPDGNLVIRSELADLVAYQTFDKPTPKRARGGFYEGMEGMEGVPGMEGMEGMFPGGPDGNLGELGEGGYPGPTRKGRSRTEKTKKRPTREKKRP